VVEALAALGRGGERRRACGGAVREQGVVAQPAGEAALDQAEDDDQLGIDPHRERDGADEDPLAQPSDGGRAVGQLGVERSPEHGPIDTVALDVVGHTVEAGQAVEHPLDPLDGACPWLQCAARAAEDQLQQTAGPPGVRPRRCGVARPLGQARDEGAASFGPFGLVPPRLRVAPGVGLATLVRSPRRRPSSHCAARSHPGPACRPAATMATDGAPRPAREHVPPAGAAASRSSRPSSVRRQPATDGAVIPFQGSRAAVML
jgi:hypothetical protein